MVRLICGLGNPSADYEHTRHNLGFDIIDRLCERKRRARRGRSELYEVFTLRSGQSEVHLLKPLTFVNRSGLAVAEAMRRYEIEISELFVISDDFNLPLGTLRIRRRGSAGGHHGLESIIEELGTTEFARLRVGIGPLPEGARGNEAAIVKFVLGRFRAEEEEIVRRLVSQAAEAVELVIADRFDAAVRAANSADPTPGE